MTESTWKILKLDWKTPGFFFFQKSGNPGCLQSAQNIGSTCDGIFIHVLAKLKFKLNFDKCRLSLTLSNEETSTLVKRLFRFVYIDMCCFSCG